MALSPLFPDGLWFKYLGRKLAARVLNTWHEDFVDEDTGEVVSIERNEIVLDRDTVLDKENIEEILEIEVKTILLHKESNEQGDYAIIHNTLQKDPTNSEKEAVEHIYRQLRNAEPPDEETARGIIDKLFFSDQRYNLGEVGRYRMNKKLGLNIEMDKQVLTKEDIICIIFAIFIPPLGVGLHEGITTNFWIDLILTLLFYLPGMIFALIVVLS